MDFNQLLKFAVDNNASDLHVQAGSPPMMRIAGQTRFVNSPALSNEDARNFVMSVLPESRKAEADRAIIAGIDFSYQHPNSARFRCSAFSQIGR